MSEQNERLRLQLVSGLLRQLHLETMSQRFNPRLVLALFNFINGGLSIALIAIVALITQQAFIFPSLGATAFLLFHLPLAEASSPRNAICGHLIGALCGWAALWLFNLLDAPAAFITGVDWPRVAAAGLSLGLASALMILCRVAHPPAGATALIVSLGLMPQLSQIPILIGAVALLALQALAINRLAGIAYPLWRQTHPERHGHNTPPDDTVSSSENR
ncbi:MAG: HPP family protein [Gammaproteobacteria bacterium]|jgi:CBS-domain-containing membrane protein|nr:HPP family protein [Gammaproteobacteria bacterium]MBQ0774931.1 HPP family protein [Gammaproteobacteria bacterium]|tara:strand:- start:53866 stop:54519 length:654 start_codon:yes stop_codon:yes gene_type:complete